MCAFADKLQTNDRLKQGLTHPNGFLISPLHPGNYSKNHECVFNLKAPKNFIIHLKFDDNFQLEPSNDCRYDYLEIRDGPHGYSPLIGRYCGNKTPLDITSTGRELWIRFNTDDSIELTGFRIAYEFKSAQNNELFHNANIYQQNRLLGKKLKSILS